MDEQRNKHVDEPGKAAGRKIDGNREMFLLATKPRGNLFISGLKLIIN
jgi:hypothetical protein